MAAIRKRRKSADYVTPGYQFQGLSQTYRRPDYAMVQRRSTRVSMPSAAARQAAQQKSARRVHFTPATDMPPSTTTTPTPEAIPTTVDPLLPTPASQYTTPGFESDKYAYKGQLPQSFPHGLPTSSLEPGTSDLQFPPSNIFPDPPLGNGPARMHESPLQTMVQLRHATSNVNQLVAELSESLWDKATDQERRFPHHLSPILSEDPVPAVAEVDLPTTFCTPAYIDTTTGALDVEGYIPKEAILDTGATKVMISKRFALAMAIHVTSLSKGSEFVTASGKIEVPLGVTNFPVEFNLGRGTPHSLTVLLHMTVVDTIAYDVLLGSEFMKAARGVYDAYFETFTYRWHGIDGRLTSHTIPAPCHSTSSPIIAYACFEGLINGSEELQDVQGENDPIVPTEEDFGFETSPLQLATLRFQHLREESDHSELVRLSKEVGLEDLARRGDAVFRLESTSSLTLPTLLPSSKWIGDAVNGSVPINTSIRTLTVQARQNGLHVLELFGGIGLGVLRTALAAGYTVRCYTYVDRDPTSRQIAHSVVASLREQYPEQLPPSATRAFDKRLPQNISTVSDLFLSALVVSHGPVDLLGGSWECQSLSRAGRQRGMMDPRFQYFYDMVRIVNFFQREQQSSMVYILENTYPGGNSTPAVKKAGELVQAFLGAPIIIDAADLGAAAHRVRLFWTNMLPAATLQAALPTLLPPLPSLDDILQPYHLPSQIGHTDRLPFAQQNQVGWGRVCMPTIVSYLRSNAFRTKLNGEPGEGEVYNIQTLQWEEPDVEEKELLLGFRLDDTATPGVTSAARAIRIGRALEGNTMRWLGAFLHAAQP